MGDWDDEEADPQGLRYYQRAAHDLTMAELQAGESPLVVMATGLGKTRLASAIISNWPGRVLFLAHRDELLDQARAEIQRQTGEWVDLEKAEYMSFRARIVVGSVQTLGKVSKDWQGKEELRRLDRLVRLGGRPTMVIVDEAHRAVTASYSRLLTAIGAPVMGITATTQRLDKKSLGRRFTVNPYKMDVAAGIEAGYLVPFEARAVNLASIDLRDVRRGRGEGGLNLHELDLAMTRAVEHITVSTLELEPDRQGIAFFPGVRSAQYAADRFNALRPGSALCITGETDPEERKDMVKAYRNGGYQYLCNCEVAVEGFDAPATSLIIAGRPTTSVTFYTQMMGRGGRTLPGVVDGVDGAAGAWLRRDLIARSAKPNCVVLDFVGNGGKHSLVSPTDVFAGTYSDEEREAAKRIVREASERDESVDPQEALLKAREELRQLAQSIESEVKSEVIAYDPFRVFGMKPQHVGMDRKKPSEKLLGALQRAGIPGGELKKMDATAARKLMATVIKRREVGLCTYGQLAKLQEHGVVRRNVTFDRAKRGIDYLKETGWGKRTDRETLREIVGDLTSQ